MRTRMVSSSTTGDEPVRGIHAGPPGPLMKIVRDQRVAFLLVGGANTAFSTGLFIVLALAFEQAPSFILLSVSWFVSLVAVFFVYRKLVFRVSGHVWLDLGRFALVNLTSLLVNVVLLSFFADFLNFPRIPTQLVITALSVIISYFGHRHFSFRRKASAGSPAKPAAGIPREEETA
ncbi:GtrA family protein [Pseudarthrobacter sp. NPDC058329]|uniref:GtrA family protein n=1 Tax=Pseudarthrobacter sp. NPDC058329 TaxID=3346448 RepID=UPI0036DA42B8